MRKVKGARVTSTSPKYSTIIPSPKHNCGPIFRPNTHNTLSGTVMWLPVAPYTQGAKTTSLLSLSLPIYPPTLETKSSYISADIYTHERRQLQRRHLGHANRLFVTWTWRAIFFFCPFVRRGEILTGNGSNYRKIGEIDFLRRSKYNTRYIVTT